jgi:hypothetical protein
MRRAGGILAVVLGALLGTACFVEINHVSDPTEAFRQAKTDAERLQGRPGPAHDVNVLVYDRGERELVRVSVPLWLVRKLDHHGDLEFDDDDDHDGDHDGHHDSHHDRDEHWKRTVRRHVSLKDLEKAGLGVLVEVDEEAGDKMLVWLR